MDWKKGNLELIQDRSDWKVILTWKNLFYYILSLILSGINIYIIVMDVFYNFMVSGVVGFISQNIVAVVFIYLMFFKPIREKRREEARRQGKHNG